MPGDASSRSPRSAARGGRRRAHPPRATVDRITQRNGIVSVARSDGTSGDYDLVVGADGINSAVRRLAFEPASAPQAVGQVGWRFVAARPPQVTTWSVMLGRRTAFLTLPIADDRVYCYCDVPSQLETPTTPTAPRPSSSRGCSPSSPIQLRRCSTRSTPRVRSTSRRSRRWSSIRGCVTVSYSSATPRTRHHRTWPRARRWRSRTRSCSAVCLRDIEPIPYALATFEARRRPRTDWVRAQTHRRDRTRYLPPTVRDNVLRVFGRRIMHANYRPLLDDP